MNKTKYSQDIKTVIDILEQFEKANDCCNEEIKNCDDLTQDYLHSMELDNLNYKERAKVATKLSECRKNRRKCKDTLQATQPLYDFIMKEKLINRLKEILGKTRNIEENQKARRYYNRVL